MLHTAVVGLGWWGKQIINCLRDSDRIKIVRAVDVDADHGAAFAASNGIEFTDQYERVLEDSAVDAVILVTPHALHENQVLAAAAAGKQIFCEKPFSLTAASAKRMIMACQEANLIIGIGHERRYEGALVEMKRMVDTGELGTLLHIEFNASYNLFMGSPATGWRLDTQQAPAGTMTALGVHQTDYIQTLAGRVKTINARMCQRSADYPSDDILSIHIEFENGMLGSFTSIATTPFYQRMTVFGDRAWAEIREVANVDKPDPTILTWRDLDDEIHSRTYKRTDTVRENLHEWATAVAGEGVYRFTIDQILHNVEILDAIVQSSATGSPVRLSDL